MSVWSLSIREVFEVWIMNEELVLPKFNGQTSLGLDLALIILREEFEYGAVLVQGHPLIQEARGRSGIL